LRVRDPNRLTLVLAIGTLCACVAWALASRYIVPELIRSAYYGTGWPVLDRMITAQVNHPLSSRPLSFYVTNWNEFAWRMLFMLLLSGLVVLLVARPEFQNAFWGPEPGSFASGRGAEATAQGVTAGVVKPSCREKLAGFARSREIALLFGVILPLALVLRLHSLGARSFNEDEIVSALLARWGLSRFLSTVTHWEANMALYYVILRFWIHLGQSEFVIRSLSVIFALAAVVALYSLGTRAFGKQVGILGALLLAINGFHIQYSQDARSYTLLVFLVTLSSLFLLQSVREGSRRNWIRYVVTSTLAIYAHSFAVFVLVAHGVSLLFLPRRQAPWRRFVPTTAAIGLLALPMVLFLLLRNNGELSWVPRTNAWDVYNLFACLAGKPDVSLRGYSAALLLCAFSIPVVIAILALAKSSPWSIERTETWHLTFFLTWLSVPIVLILAISIRQPVFVPRFLIICLPPFILLGSYGLSRFWRAWLAVALLCVIAGLTARGLLAYYEAPGADWRRAAQYILSNQKPGDAAVFFPDHYQVRLEYYLQKESAGSSNLALLVPPADSSFDSLLPGLPFHYDRVWFIGQNELTKTPNLQKRSIDTSLAAEFPGIREEKRFPGGLIVTLYCK
jgi:mannosyltransferase